MTIDERQRYQLHQPLETHLGPEAAATLMAYLPPVGWADVATKHDLAALEQRLELRFEGIDQRFEGIEQRFELRFDGMGHRLTAEIADVRTEIHKTARTMTLTIVGATAAIVSVVAALTNLFG